MKIDVTFIQMNGSNIENVASNSVNLMSFKLLSKNISLYSPVSDTAVLKTLMVFNLNSLK